MAASDHSKHSSGTGLLAKWNRMPLYSRIVMAMAAGVVVGMILGRYAEWLEIPSKVILQLLSALAPPLILVAVVHILMTTTISAKVARRLAALLLINTTVAILIGLTVANVLKPGKWSAPKPPDQNTAQHDGEPQPETPSNDATPKKDAPPETAGPAAPVTPSPLELLTGNVPKSILGPLGDKQNIIGVIVIAVAFGLALRDLRHTPLNTVENSVEVAYKVLLKMLHWVIQLVPIGVFAIVAHEIGIHGFASLLAMGAFILAVLVALALQTTWYLVRIRVFSWVRPWSLLRNMRDALIMAFSTSSSTATMPVTYACLRDKVGIREESASIGALVGANFNNDGTALYEAMAALFVAQLIGQDLTLSKQLIVILTSIIASVGAAGIPEAGLVTMTLVFTAVGLPTHYIALLLTVDWFLDRCRTTINVLGDVNISCLLDGRVPKPKPASIPASD